MKHALEIPILEADTLQFHPLTIREGEGEGKYLVGFRASKSYLWTSETGATAIRLMRDGLAIGQVKARLEASLGTRDFTLAPLLETLLTAGMISAVGARKIEGRPLQKGIALPRWISARLLSCVFGWPAVAAYFLLLLMACMAWRFHVTGLLNPTEIFASAKYSVLAPIAILLGYLNAVKHEMAHALAAWNLGLSPRFSMGRRFLFPVLQTDLTELWEIPPRQRYAAYAAGMVSDLLVVAGIVVMSAAATLLHLEHVFPAWTRLGLSLTVFLILPQVAFQFAIFMRTDVYYMVATALNCRDLNGDAERFLWRLLAPVLGKRPVARAGRSGKTPAWMKVYAVGLAAGNGLAGLFFLFYLLVLVRVWFAPQQIPAWSRLARFDLTDKTVFAATFLVSLAAALYSMYKEKRRRKTVYRVRMEEAV